MKNFKNGSATVWVLVIAIAIAIAITMYFLKVKSDSQPAETNSVTFSPSETKDCGSDNNCLVEAARTCALAKRENKTTVDFSGGIVRPVLVAVTDTPNKFQQTQRTLQEITGSKDGKCNFTIRVLDVISPNLTEDTKNLILQDVMTCSYSNADLATRLENSIKGISSFAVSSTDTPAQAMKKRCDGYGVLRV